MSIGRSRLLVASAVSLVIVALAALIWIASYTFGQQGPLAQLSLPAVFSSYPVDAELGDDRPDAVMRLEAGGEAEVTNVTLGTIGMNQQGRSCVTLPALPVSGSGRWTVEADGTILIEVGALRAAFVPGIGRLGEKEWTELRQLLCDGTSVDFGSSL